MTSSSTDLIKLPSGGNVVLVVNGSWLMSNFHGETFYLSAEDARAFAAAIAPPALAPAAAPAVTDEMVAGLVSTLEEIERASGAPWSSHLARKALARYRAALANTGAPVREGEGER